MPHPPNTLSIWLEEQPSAEIEHPTIILCWAQGRERGERTLSARDVGSLSSVLVPILLAKLYELPRHVRPIRERKAAPPLNIDNILESLKL